MSDTRTLRRLRAFLFALAALLFAGAIVELLLAEHWDEPMQLVPFALCGLGLAMLALVRLRPSRAGVVALRAVMAVVVAGSLLGIFEHFQGNREFALEVHPDAGGFSQLRSAVSGGDPLLAPGVLAVGAAVAIAATHGLIDGDAGAGQTREWGTSDDLPGAEAARATSTARG